jgi:uncharacterized protein (DUF433 family)
MGVIVDRWPTRVDAHFALSDGPELFLAPTEGVKELQRRHSVENLLQERGFRNHEFCKLRSLTLPQRYSNLKAMDYQKIITIEPGKRGGQPCIRGLRITVYDVLDYLASGMTEEEILQDFPDLTAEDIKACLAFAADRERKLMTIST